MAGILYIIETYMNTEKMSLGARGENFATEYLEKKRYKIIARNVREKWGEIDIIARAPDKTLVFVEVKTMRAGELIPEDQMSFAKLEKFRRAVSLYANSHEELINGEVGFRLDVIALVARGEEFVVRHYENV